MPSLRRKRHIKALLNGNARAKKSYIRNDPVNRSLNEEDTLVRWKYLLKSIRDCDPLQTLEEFIYEIDTAGCIISDTDTFRISNNALATCYIAIYDQPGRMKIFQSDLVIAKMLYYIHTMTMDEGCIIFTNIHTHQFDVTIPHRGKNEEVVVRFRFTVTIANHLLSELQICGYVNML